MKKLNTAGLNGWLASINEKQRVYLPIEQAGQVNYGVWTGDAKVCLDTLRTVKSAKDAFFPQVENMMNFKAEGKNLSVEMIDPKAEDFVVMGVRACDARSFDILDKVFLSDPYDPFYAARREHSTVVTLACGRPDENCFCVNFGIDPADPQGDATMWIVDDTIYLRANTDKGTALVEGLEDADEQAVKAQQAKTREVCEKLPFAHLNLKGEVRQPQVGGALPGVPGLRHLHLRLPHMPVLRHSGLRHGFGRPALSLLGQLHVFRLHPDGPRHQPSHPGGALPPAVHAQADLLPLQQRGHVLLRGLRSLPGQVPAESQYRQGYQGAWR